MHVVECHVVRGAGVVRASDGATVVLQLNFIGPDAGELIQSILFARRSQCGDQNDRSRADDHTEHSEEESRLAGTEAVDREPDDLAEHHGRARAGQRTVKGARFGEVRGRHEL